MRLGGLVLSASHIGGERRHAGREDSRRWAEDNGERRNGRSLLSLLPKGSLVTIILLLSAYTGWLSKGWIDHVNHHIARAADSLDRLGAVEALADQTAGTVAVMRVELMDMREDQLEHYKWMAEIEGDRVRAKDIQGKLDALKSGNP